MSKPVLQPMEEAARGIARRIAPALPPGVGFCLILFNFGPDGFSTYISNGQRADMIEALREMITKLEAS